MKKKLIFIALFLILSLFIVFSNKIEANEYSAYNLVSEYYNEFDGEYTKKTQIHLSEEVKKEYQVHFHVNAYNALDRTTYYSPGYLFMGDLDGKVEEINSGFYEDEATNKLKHFKYVDGKFKVDYTVNKPTLKEYFVVLDDMINEEEGFFEGFDAVSETKYTYNVKKVEGGIDTKLHEFLWFAAPGLNDSFFTSEVAGNYFTHEGITLVVEELSHVFYGEYLSFKIILDPTDIGKVKSEEEIADYNGEELVLCEARVYKGLKYFDENDYYSTFTTKFTNNYIYRLGNVNAVKLGSLFAADIPVLEDAEVSVNVEALDGSNVSGVATYNSNWENTTIKLSGTGLAKISISTCEENVYSMIVEVVDATNVTTYGELKNQNSVLLNDITMSSGSTYHLSNATLYGNGFTFDMTNGAYKAGGNVSSNYVFNLANAKIDNAVIVGAVYTQYGAQASSDYNRAAILTNGNCVIENSYVSNCASAIRIKEGNLEIINSTVKGGNFANIDIRSGSVVLDNVTTINQVNGNDLASDGSVVVGLGVVVYYENGTTDTTIEVKNGITQYNYLSKNQAKVYIKDATASILTDAMFNSDYSSVQYNDGTDTWVNAGILSMTNTVGNSNVTDIDGYEHANPSMTGVTGYLHTPKPTASNVTTVVPTYESTKQGFVAPTYSFDHYLNNVDKTDGSNDYCVVDNGVVNISMDEGDKFEWNPNILNVGKNGKALSYTVTMNEVDYTGKNIFFDEAGQYQVVYTYTDSYNYSLDAEGNVVNVNKVYTKVVNITVAVIEATTKHAEFTFGTSNTKTEIININGKSYISAVGVTADNTNWTYMEINGQKIYYPVVAATLTSTKGSSSYAYFPVFKNTITITDYAANGNGEAFTYNATTNAMPANLTAVKGVCKTAADVPNLYTVGDSGLSSTGAATIFKWQSASSAPATPSMNKSMLSFSSPKIEANREKCVTYVQYSYTDQANMTYYYYVAYTTAAFEKTSCVTSDTLVTLADGSTKAISEVLPTDSIKVWDFFNGEYTYVNSSIIKNHGYDYHNVLTLTFEDGTKVNTINGHGFYESTSNEFVIINEENVECYLGHSFVKEDLTTTKLVSYEVNTEYTESWSILSARYHNAVLEGMLTITPAEVDGSPKFLMPFEVTSEMKYDEVKMNEEIDQYGLYTYEDFAPYVSEEVFEALGLAYFKVSVGKGYITFDEIVFLLEIHFGK